MTFSLYAMAGSLHFHNLYRSLHCRPEARRVLHAMRRHLVRRPLDAVQIDSFFVHLVEGRQVPEFSYFSDHEIADVIDLLLGVEAPEAESNARVRQFITESHGAKHVAGLEAGRSARRTGAHRDVLDGHHEPLPLDEIEGDVEVSGQSVLEGPVDVHLVEVLLAVAPESLAQSEETRRFLFPFCAPDLGGLAEAA